MPLLSDHLSVWDIAFRWAGFNPRDLWLRLPLDVQDHSRNLMDAILKAELACMTITLEKRHFEPDEKDFSVYHWIDDIYLCIQGIDFNRKLLRHALIERYDLKLWCERLNIPLPEFWFPTGWNLEYELPEGDIHPGHWYYRKDWTSEQWQEWQAEREAAQNESAPDANSPLYENGPASPDDSSDTATSQTSDSKQTEAGEKLRPSQHAKIACQQIAAVLWKDDQNRTIASVIADELIQKFGGGSHYNDETIREWVKVVAPPHVRNRRGRPKKGGEDQ